MLLVEMQKVVALQQLVRESAATIQHEQLGKATCADSSMCQIPSLADAAVTRIQPAIWQAGLPDATCNMRL